MSRISLNGIAPSYGEKEELHCHHEYFQLKSGGLGGAVGSDRDWNRPEDFRGRSRVRRVGGEKRGEDGEPQSLMWDLVTARLGTLVADPEQLGQFKTR